MFYILILFVGIIMGMLLITVLNLNSKRKEEKQIFEEYKNLHVYGSNKGIGSAGKLVIALCYQREYRAMRQMAKNFDLALSTVCNSISLVENTLKKDKEFQFQDIKIEIEKYENKNGNIEFVIGDVTEQQILV